MEISITHQCQIFLFSILLGALLSLLFDVFRLLRLILPEQEWRIAIEDVAYCLLCAILTLYFALEWEQGRIRSYLLLGELLGWILCHFTLGELFYTVEKYVVVRMKKGFRWFRKQILRPIYKLLHGIWSFIAEIGKFVKKICKKLSLQLKFFLKRRGLLLYNLIKSEKRPIFRKR